MRTISIIFGFVFLAIVGLVLAANEVEGVDLPKEVTDCLENITPLIKIYNRCLEVLRADDGSFEDPACVKYNQHKKEYRKRRDECDDLYETLDEGQQAYMENLMGSLYKNQ